GRERVVWGGPGAGGARVEAPLGAGRGGLAWLVACRVGPALRGAVVRAALVGLLAVPALATVAPVWLPLSALAHPAPAPEPTAPREVPRPPLPQAPERPAVPAATPAQPAVKPAPLPADLIDPIEEPAPHEITADPARVGPPPPP